MLFRSKKLQDVTLYHGTTQEAGMKIQKEGLKAGGITSRVFTTTNKAVAKKYAIPGKGVVVEISVPDKLVEDEVGRLKNLPEVITFKKGISHRKIKHIKRAEDV